MISLIDILVDVIYPENISCIICDNPISKSNTYSLCKSCFEEIHFIKEGCYKCGKPSINNILEKLKYEECSYCFDKTFYFDRVISCIEYNDISKNLILKFKYQKKTYMSKYIAKIISEKLSLEDIRYDYILFVPLHKKRYKKRGFNQSEKIAKYLSEITKVEVLNCINRKNNTKALYKLDRIDRKKELKNAFALEKDHDKLKNKNIILVDDIFTTGSTTNEISKILKINNVNKIYVVTLLNKSNNRYVVNKY